MRNAGLEEAQAGIKIAWRSISNLRYADDTTLMAESEEELKSLLIKVKQESEKVGLKNEVSQSCPTLCDPMDCNLLGSSVHGIFQARILEWVAIFFSRRSSLTQELNSGLKCNIQKTKIMASSPITSWQIDAETMQTVTDFIFLDSKITVDGDCSHEPKRCSLLGRKAMTNLDSVLKNRDITLPTKVCLVKAMIFPVVMMNVRVGP